MNCLIILACIALVILGPPLMFYGRNRLVRSIGAVISSIPAPLIAWVSVSFTIHNLGHQLWLHQPGPGDVYVVGENVTFRELLWVPLQDVGFCIILPSLILLFAPWLDRLGRRRKEHTTLVDLLEELLFATPMKWLLEKPSRAAHVGQSLYISLLGATLLVVLPLTGLVGYLTLQLLLLDGALHPFKEWLDSMRVGVIAILSLIFLGMNVGIALRLFGEDGEPAQHSV